MIALLDAKRTSPLNGGPSFSLGHRLLRLAWGMTWGLLAAWTPPPLRPWRIALLRIFGARVASSANVYGSAHIWYPPNLIIEEYATVGPRADIYCMAVIRLGPYALVSQGAFLCGGTHDIDDPHFQLTPRSIRVGAKAWIAADAFVGPGVNIGDGAVLGARAVTTKDLEPWTVYAGNPAKALRRRSMV